MKEWAEFVNYRNLRSITPLFRFLYGDILQANFKIIFTVSGTQILRIPTCNFSDDLFLFYHFSGDIIMTGEGHKDWIADCDFHPG
jgi:hypothetical protein